MDRYVENMPEAEVARFKAAAPRGDFGSATRMELRRLKAKCRDGHVFDADSSGGEYTFGSRGCLVCGGILIENGTGRVIYKREDL